MKKYKLLLAALCLILLVNWMATSTALAVEEKTSFSGVRYLEFSVDASDLENFVDGGRTVFDLILRSNAPEWMNYQIATENRDVILSLKFEFSSYEDYCEKLAELLTYSPSIVYEESEGVLLLENYSAMEVLNSLQTILVARECLNEKLLDEFLILRENKMTLNSVTYQGEERIFVRPENSPVVKMNLLNITTTSNEDGAFVRKITANINPKVEKSKDIVLSRFNEVGKSVQNDLTEEKLEICVEFTANNQNELIRKTMNCLGVTTSITEKQCVTDKGTLSVERCEFFDLENLMNEDGQFSYSFTHPTYVSNLTEQMDEVQISGLTVTANNVSEISYQYESAFKFSEIEVVTDFSDFFGKKKRTIILTAPIDVASDYHEIIKTEMQERLIKGSIFHIYDDGGKRKFEISFSSFFMDEIAEFSMAVLNTNRTIQYSRSWLPYGECSVHERIEFKNLLPEMVPPNESIMTYKLPASFRILSEEVMDNEEITDSSIAFSVKSSDNLNFKFSSLNIFRLIIVIFLMAAVVTVVIIGYKKKLNYAEDKKC